MKEKFCILFNFDSETQMMLREIHEKMLQKFPNLISALPVNGITLPYHMTMLGTINLGKGYAGMMINQAIRKIKPFSHNVLPKLEDLKSSQLPGDSLGIRLKFLPGSYVLTGIPEVDIVLAKMLGAEKFDFDLVNHITLFQVKNGFMGIDQVLPTFKELFFEYKDCLAQMKFIPQVWKKVDNQRWTVVNLKS